MRVVSDNSCRENQNTHLMFNNVFFLNRAVYKITWKNIVQPERPQMKVWRMRMTSWIPGATDTCTLRCLHQECYCEAQMRLLCDKDTLETIQNEFKLQSLRQTSAPDVLNSQLISGRFREAVFTSTSHNSYVHYCFASCLILSSGKVSSLRSVIFLVDSASCIQMSVHVQQSNKTLFSTLLQYKIFLFSGLCFP